MGNVKWNFFNFLWFIWDNYLFKPQDAGVFFLTKVLNKLCICIILLHSKCFVNLDKCSYFENRQLFFAIATLCLLPWKLFVELCTWIHKLHRYSALAHRPPVDLHLIFEKSSLKNQVGQTWFFVYFKHDFCRPHWK